MDRPRSERPFYPYAVAEEVGSSDVAGEPKSQTLSLRRNGCSAHIILDVPVRNIQNLPLSPTILLVSPRRDRQARFPRKTSPYDGQVFLWHVHNDRRHRRYRGCVFWSQKRIIRDQRILLLFDTISDSRFNDEDASVFVRQHGLHR